MRRVTRDGETEINLIEPADSEGAVMAAVVDSGFLSLVAVDLDGTIVHWNRAAERLFGWPSAEAIGCSVDLILPADRRDEFGAMMSSLRRGEEVAPVETVRLTRDGRTVRVYLQISPVVDELGALIGASTFAFDYTEPAATRAALMASESRYRTLVEALAEFVIVTSADGLADGLQPSWVAYTGQEASTTNRDGWRAAVHADDRDEFDTRWLEGVATVEPFSIAARLLRHDGEYRYCEARVAPMQDPWGRVVEWIAAFSDVHEHHLAEERERYIADRFRQIVAANVFGVCYGEHDRIFDANDVMLGMMGARRRDLMGGIRVDELIPGGMASARSEPVGDGEGREYEIKRRDGSTGYFLTASVSLAPDPGWISFAVDVTQRKAAERESEHRALHDALTGLPNRRVLVDRLQHALARSARQGSLTGVLFCDLDHFKEINDTLGHATGDRALQTIARRLEPQLRDSDTVARTGGDEFVVLLEDLAGPEDAAVVAERIRVALSAPLSIEAHQFHITCSIGISLSAGGADRVEDLLSRADLSMYVAKHNGRDQIALGADEPGSRAVRRSVIDLRDGGARGAGPA